MARETGKRAALMDAVRALGIDPDNCAKVIIEIDYKEPVKVYTQGYASEGLLGVVKALDGDICVVREVGSDG